MKTISLILINLVLSTVMFGSSFIIPTKPATVYNSIEDILKTIDPTILPHYPGQEFAEGVNVNGNYIEVLTQKAGDIRSYITSKYSEYFSDFSNSEIIALGIIMVHYQEGWFVVGGGRNGVEFNFILIFVLLTIMFPNGFKKTIE